VNSCTLIAADASVQNDIDPWLFQNPDREYSFALWNAILAIPGIFLCGFPPEFEEMSFSLIYFNDLQPAGSGSLFSWTQLPISTM
jgi:hypothetical protein